MPGEVPPYVKPRVFAVQNANTGHISRASVRLSFLLDDGPDRRVYSVLRYVLHGPVPRDFGHHGFRVFD